MLTLATILDFSMYATMILFIIVCLFLVLIVLIQKGRGGGLASAFGGASGNTAFGSKTGDVLTWATSIVFGIFLVLAISLNLLANARFSRNNKPIGARSAPVAPVAPAPVAPESETPAASSGQSAPTAVL